MEMESPVGTMQFTRGHLNNGADDLLEMVEREVRSWYRIFYAWSRAHGPCDEQGVLPIYNTLADDFRVLLTSGDMMNKAEYWQRLVSLYGTRREDPPSQIVNLELVRLDKDHVLVTFDLYKHGVKKKKFDSAVMRRQANMPGGVAWVYVHESVHDLSEAPVFANIDTQQQ
jgi:hypothetical protein